MVTNGAKFVTVTLTVLPAETVLVPFVAVALIVRVAKPSGNVCVTFAGLPLTACGVDPSPQLMLHAVMLLAPAPDDDKPNVYSVPSLMFAGPVSVSTGANSFTATVTALAALNVPSSSVAVALIVRAAASVNVC